MDKMFKVGDVVALNSTDRATYPEMVVAEYDPDFDEVVNCTYYSIKMGEFKIGRFHEQQLKLIKKSSL